MIPAGSFFHLPWLGSQCSALTLPSVVLWTCPALWKPPLSGCSLCHANGPTSLKMSLEQSHSWGLLAMTSGTTGPTYHIHGCPSGPTCHDLKHHRPHLLCPQLPLRPHLSQPQAPQAPPATSMASPQAPPAMTSSTTGPTCCAHSCPSGPTCHDLKHHRPHLLCPQLPLRPHLS
ncbi:hypothetical protein P7K49_015075 [Saguinus oedipus]|uniref:Uncharacterized protein n=1 Tax=Saguinus oedipus TaxID=9490 RepID=A0ABQ9TZP4_SAGOE|nr:hypothetical protein P7K49_031250 [Saguinus oedipus]KAK2105561.1 hypothetical protein P7K49_015075 [Saguinus oedipus]